MSKSKPKNELEIKMNPERDGKELAEKIERKHRQIISDCEAAMSEIIKVFNKYEPVVIVRTVQALKELYK
jgi:hypothetical protein